MKRYFFILLFALACSARADAASLRFSPSVVRPGEASDISVVLDTEGESVNALEGEFAVPEEFGAARISDGDSIVSFWLEAPAIAGGKIGFSGLIPGGYTGAGGTLLKLRVLPQKDGSFQMGLPHLKLYLNDGAGTEAKAVVGEPVLEVAAGAAAGSLAEDRQPPESFVPELARSETEFENKWFLAFATADKGSGMDHYEVMEVSHSLWGRAPSEWTVASSPYVIRDQSLQSDLYVRAVDKAGNFRIVSIPARPRSNQQWLYVALVLGLVCLMLIWRGYRAYRTWRSAS